LPNLSLTKKLQLLHLLRL